MTFIIVGASAGLGRAITEKFASEKNDLIIISSDMRDLISLKSDLEIRFKVKITPIEISLKDTPKKFDQVRNELKTMTPLEGIILPIGFSDSEDMPGLSNEKAMEILNVNLISVFSIINYFLDLLKERKTTIIGFGSIAAIRGRQRNVIYSASKRGLESFFESLRHYLQDFDITVQFYVLGYLDTNLSFNDEKAIFSKRADVKKLASIVYEDKFKNIGISIYPKSWKIIKLLLPFVPWFIFKKVKV